MNVWYFGRSLLAIWVFYATSFPPVVCRTDLSLGTMLERGLETLSPDLSVSLVLGVTTLAFPHSNPSP